MLLRTRSILVQAFILLVFITLAKSQENYDSEYNIEDDAADHSRYEGGEAGEGHVHPDYSKYYAVDNNNPTNAAQIQGRSDTGFVAPIEFSTFFGSPHSEFGASTNQEILKPLVAEAQKDNGNGFVSDKDFKGGFAEYNANGFGGAQDFFEQAQKQENQQEEDEEGAEQKPGPSYISHRVPVKKGRYESDVEILREKPINRNYESRRIPKPSQSEEQISSLDENDFKPSPSLPLAEFQPTNPSKILEEVAGKSGQLPYNPEQYKQYLGATQQPTPYQKYSFQQDASNFGLKDPSILNNFQSTAAPFNPNYLKVASTAATNYEYQPSETVAQNVRGKGCVRVNRKVSKQPMNCYVCKDPKTGAKSEQCSYTNEPTPKSYYKTTSHAYGNPEGYRNKRDESKSYADPYEEIKAKSHDYNSKPDQFEKDYYKSPDFSQFNQGYSYPEGLTDKEAEDKSYSEVQSEQLLKKGGENCHKSHKNGITCTVCKDAKTGANFEQCSYESAPNEKKYAYVKESKFDGEGNPIEEKVTGSTDPQPAVKDAESFSPVRRSDEAAEEEQDEAEETKSSENKESAEEPKTAKLFDASSYEIPRHFAENTYNQQKAGVRGLDPELYGSAEESKQESEKSEEEAEEDEEKSPQKYNNNNFDEYHLKLFPQFANQESKQEETRAEPDNAYFTDLSGKKDVEKVLEEFTKKDRSNCKQIQKKGMTCYLCVNKQGIQQEECMYVSESRPQSSHVAYHEMQHVKEPKPASPVVAESKIIPEEAQPSESQKRKRFFKKAITSALGDSEANASTIDERRVKFNPVAAASTKVNKKLPKNHKRDTESEEEKDKDKLDASKDPQPEFDVNDEGGLYAAETQPVYSKALGLSLPRYMLEKSYIEKEFDDTVSEYN